jgi:hypothetical protein
MFQIKKKGEDGYFKSRSSEFFETTVIYLIFRMERVPNIGEWVLYKL